MKPTHQRFAEPWQLDAAAASAARSAGEHRNEEAWSLLADLVRIDSGPGDIGGLDRTVQVMRRAWDGLDFETSVLRTPRGLPVLVAERPVDPGVPTLLLVGHLDTVFGPGTTAEWTFHVDGDRAFGPGVADAKGGAVGSWLAVATLLAITDGLPGSNLRVVQNTDEEVGSVESRSIIEDAARNADLALIFEPARPDGSIIHTRRGARRYRIRVAGKAAHTGVEPWNGVNAIEAAAHKILALQQLNDRGAHLSVNVTVIRGGQAVNVIPAEVQMDVDVRLPGARAGTIAHAAVEAIVRQVDVPGSSGRYEIISERPAMSPHPLVPRLVARFHAAARALGVALTDTATGGASDGNFTSAVGTPTIDGLGPVGGGYHTLEEFVLASTLLERAVMTALVMTTLGAASGSSNSGQDVSLPVDE